LETGRKDVRRGFSRRVCMIMDIDNRRDFENSSQIYCTGRGRGF
jgi:hypothetical protein